MFYSLSCHLKLPCFLVQIALALATGSSFSCFLFGDRVSLCHHAGVQWQEHSSTQTWPPKLKWSSHLSPQVAGPTGTPHHARLISVFFVGTRFCHVSHADVELLCSINSPVLTSQSAGIIRCEPPRLASDFQFCKMLVLDMIVKTTFSTYALPPLPYAPRLLVMK